MTRKLQKGGVKDNVDAAGKQEKTEPYQQREGGREQRYFGLCCLRPNVQGKGGNNGGKVVAIITEKNNNKGSFQETGYQTGGKRGRCSKAGKRDFARLTTKGKEQDFQIS